MARYSDLFEYIRIELPRASTPLMLRETRNAVIEFCERSKRVRLTGLDPILSVANQPEYDVTAILPLDDADAAIWRVIEVRSVLYDNRTVWPMSEDYLDQLSKEEEDTDTFLLAQWNAQFAGSNKENWRTKTDELPAFFFEPRPGVIRLVGIPSVSDEEIKVEPAVAPLRTTSEFPDWVFEKYAETLSHGALEKLLKIPGQGWSDDGRSVHYKKLFDKGWNDARKEALRSGVRNDQAGRTTPYV